MVNRRKQKMFNTTITLSNGVDVPQLALGTWLIDNDKAADAVKSAIELGYRHILSGGVKSLASWIHLWRATALMALR